MCADRVWASLGLAEARARREARSVGRIGRPSGGLGGKPSSLLAVGRPAVACQPACPSDAELRVLREGNGDGWLTTFAL